MRLSRNVYSEMLAHGEKELPFEACGLLSGSEEMIKTIWKAVNNKRKMNSFEINEEQVTLLLTKIEEKNECLVGIYHSHPTAPPVPSREDICFAYPDQVYFIISYAKRKPIVKCYRMKQGKVFPVKIIFYD
ncbi:M67 family metallopeptidase [Cytobacillus firmus]|uniref:M67 family metallopeptidase n=1 Tax=Cytobacillus firmus TaxID=1399 RepID=UPI002A4E1BC8|nr:M67 family metallopeptidase [Cytobacillus firmus]MED1942896.1 M67 family metallopeptidase [Cytobacillus firmus]